MSAHNVRGTGYIPTNLVGSTGQATWAQLQQMFAAGWTIGNQTMSNVDLTTLDYAGQVAELSAHRSALDAKA